MDQEPEEPPRPESGAAAKTYFDDLNNRCKRALNEAKDARLNL